MKKVSDIYSILNQISPFELQEKWDNSGINIDHQTFENIYLSLEVDLSLANNVEENSLIIVHHPLIFSPIKHFQTQSYPCNLLTLLIQKRCSVIAMHTNFDYTHLNPYFASVLLGFYSCEKHSFALKQTLPSTPFDTLAQQVKNKLNLSSLKTTKASQNISEVYLVCGSGSSAISLIPPHTQSCLITGDIKYHTAMEAISLGISLIDVGHYESERHFAKILLETLQNFGYEAIIHNSENPFKMY